MIKDLDQVCPPAAAGYARETSTRSRVRHRRSTGRRGHTLDPTAGVHSFVMAPALSPVARGLSFARGRNGPSPTW